MAPKAPGIPGTSLPPPAPRPGDVSEAALQRSREALDRAREAEERQSETDLRVDEQELRLARTLVEVARLATALEETLAEVRRLAVENGRQKAELATALGTCQQLSADLARQQVELDRLRAAHRADARHAGESGGRTAALAWGSVSGPLGTVLLAGLVALLGRLLGVDLGALLH